MTDAAIPPPGASSANTDIPSACAKTTPCGTAHVQDEQPCKTSQPTGQAEHEDGDAIRRQVRGYEQVEVDGRLLTDFQVEFYFSDENLPSDAHLLMKTGGHQNLPVSIKHICGFAKMRKYKPYRAVVESLKKSHTLEVVDNKYIVRTVPLTIAPTVVAQEVAATSMTKAKGATVSQPQLQPWLTKAMVRGSPHLLSSSLTKLIDQTYRL